jgi:membrane protein involved in colicin uptake
MRTANDWGNLVLAELDGREERGAVAKILASITGHRLADDSDIGATSGALLKLAESLKAPDLIRKQIGELSKAAADSKTAAQSVRDEQAKLDRAKAALENLRREHEAAMAAELKAHQAFLEKERAESAADRKQAAEVLEKAATDAKKNAAIRADLERRLDLIRAA